MPRTPKPRRRSVRQVLVWALGIATLFGAATWLTDDTHERVASAPPSSTASTGPADAEAVDAVSEEVSELVEPPPMSIDADGDGRSDPAVLRGATWWVLGSTAGAITETVDLDGAVLVPGDYDGDRTTDLATVTVDGDSMVWTLGSAGTRSFGVRGDRPVPADYNGDLVTDVAVVREVDGALVWLVDTPGVAPVEFGAPGDQPVPADYDGDGRADIAVRRSSDWYVRRTSDGVDTVTGFGIATDLVAPGDFDGDGRADIAIVRAVAGAWQWWVQPPDGTSPVISTFGRSGPDAQTPLAGDFDGDGRTEPAVVDAREGLFLWSVADGEFETALWGVEGDVAVSAL